MSQPTISVCMIVRNEEDQIDRCLRSVSDWVDEIILVDTGCEDKTLERAKNYPCTMISSPWEDDFSQARNVALSAATSQWILTLDADEEVPESSKSKILQFIKRNDVVGCELRIKSLGDDGNAKELVSAVRLFQNNPSVRYQNFIHEQILPTLDAFALHEGKKIDSTDIELVHYGYQSDIEHTKNKRERNERLFLKQVQSTPEDPFIWYKFGDFLSSWDPQRSFEAYQSSWSLLEKCSKEEARLYPFGGDICAIMAFSLKHSHNSQGGLDLLMKNEGRYPFSPNFSFATGCLALDLNQGEVAEKAFLRCIENADKVFPVPVQDEVRGPASFFGLAKALILQNKAQDATGRLMDALKICPSYGQAAILLAELLSSNNLKEKAVGVLSNHLEHLPQNGLAWWKGGKILFELAKYEKSCQWLEKAASAPNPPQELVADLNLAKEKAIKT